MTKKHTWKPSQSVPRREERDEIIKQFKIDLLTQCLYAPRMTKLLQVNVCNSLSQLLHAEGIYWRLAPSEIDEIIHVLYSAGFSSDDNNWSFIK